jgi:hypothetical protein
MTNALARPSRAKLGSFLRVSNLCRTVLDWEDEGVRPYLSLADSSCGSFHRPYTKKKNTARPMKNSVPPNIHNS